MTLGRFLAGLIGMACGLLIIIYRAQVKDITGNINFAEKYLGTGGTWTLIILVGILIFAGSLMWMFGTLQELFYQFFGRFFGV